MNDSGDENSFIYSSLSGIKMLSIVLIIVIVFAKAYYMTGKFWYSDDKNPYKNMTLTDFYSYSFDNMVFNNKDKITLLSRVQQCVMLFIVFTFLD